MVGGEIPFSLASAWAGPNRKRTSRPIRADLIVRTDCCYFALSQSLSHLSLCLSLVQPAVRRFTSLPNCLLRFLPLFLHAVLLSACITLSINSLHYWIRSARFSSQQHSYHRLLFAPLCIRFLALFLSFFFRSLTIILSKSIYLRPRNFLLHLLRYPGLFAFVEFS